MTSETMRESRGDLWDFLGRAVVAVTTHGVVNRQGEALMNRGCARQAAERFPDIPIRLGELIRSDGNNVYELGHGLVSFPVEETPYGLSDPVLIERSCQQLVSLADDRGWTLVVMPRPGCGGGGLLWADVRPLLLRHFDSRFLIVDNASF